MARKILGGFAAQQGLTPPDDATIVRRSSFFSQLDLTHMAKQTSLFVTPLPAGTTEQSLRTALLSSIPFIQPSAVKSIVYVEKNKLVPSHLNIRADSYAAVRCAFINFRERNVAEKAAEAWAAGVNVDGTKANVRWGRSKGSSGSTTSVPTSAVISSAEVPAP